MYWMLLAPAVGAYFSAQGAVLVWRAWKQGELDTVEALGRGLMTAAVMGGISITAMGSPVVTSVLVGGLLTVEGIDLVKAKFKRQQKIGEPPPPTELGSG